MIAVIITCESGTAFPPTYSMRRITGSSTTTHTEEQLRSYFEQNQYRRIHKDRLRPQDNFTGLWVAGRTASDGDDAEAVTAFMQRLEGST
jgi:hypothetical protein